MLSVLLSPLQPSAALPSSPSSPLSSSSPFTSPTIISLLFLTPNVVSPSHINATCSSTVLSSSLVLFLLSHLLTSHLFRFCSSSWQFHSHLSNLLLLYPFLSFPLLCSFSSFSFSSHFLLSSVTFSPRTSFEFSSFLLLSPALLSIPFSYPSSPHYFSALSSFHCFSSQSSPPLLWMTGKWRRRKQERNNRYGRKKKTKDRRQTESIRVSLPHLYLVCNSDYRLLSPPALIEE